MSDTWFGDAGTPVEIEPELIDDHRALSDRIWLAQLDANDPIVDVFFQG